MPDRPVPRFEIRRRRFGRREYRVVLIGDNSKVLNVTEHLESKQAAHVNIDATIAAAQQAVIVDVSGDRG